MCVVRKASPLSAEFLLPFVHCARCLLVDYPGINALLYPLLGLPIVKFGKKLSANYKVKRARVESFEEPLASLWSIGTEDFVGHVYVDNRAHFLQP